MGRERRCLPLTRHRRTGSHLTGCDGTRRVGLPLDSLLTRPRPNPTEVRQPLVKTLSRGYDIAPDALSRLDKALRMSGASSGRSHRHLASGVPAGPGPRTHPGDRPTSVGTAAAVKQKIDLVDFIGETVPAQEGRHHLQGPVPVPRREDAQLRGHARARDVAVLRLRPGRRHLQLRDGARRRRLPDRAAQPGRPGRRGDLRAHRRARTPSASASATRSRRPSPSTTRC